MSKTKKGRTVSEPEEKLPPTEEERRNHRFSFIVGICIAMAIIILFVIFFGAR